jgi:hypothetical protein
MDVEGYPLRREIATLPEGVRIFLVCSAVRRMAALHIADELARLRDQWEELIRNLPIAQPVSM